MGLAPLIYLDEPKTDALIVNLKHLRNIIFDIMKFCLGVRRGKPNFKDFGLSHVSLIGVVPPGRPIINSIHLQVYYGVKNRDIS